MSVYFTVHVCEKEVSEYITVVSLPDWWRWKIS